MIPTCSTSRFCSKLVNIFPLKWFKNGSFNIRDMSIFGFFKKLWPPLYCSIRFPFPLEQLPHECRGAPSIKAGKCSHPKHRSGRFQARPHLLQTLPDTTGMHSGAASHQLLPARNRVLRVFHSRLDHGLLPRAFGWPATQVAVGLSPREDFTGTNTSKISQLQDTCRS